MYAVMYTAMYAEIHMAMHTAIYASPYAQKDIIHRPHRGRFEKRGGIMRGKWGSGLVLGMAAVMAAANVMPAMAASWQQDGKGWRYQKDDGSYYAGSWQWLEGNSDGKNECYYFGADGYMAAGTVTPDGYIVNADGQWIKDGVVQTQEQTTGVSVPGGAWVQGTGTDIGRYWWRNTDGTYPSAKWIWLDGNQDGTAECYYFDASGWLVTSGVTPDGYIVDKDGRWSENGIPKTMKALSGASGPGGGVGRTSGVGGGGGGSSSGGGGGSSSGGSSSGGSSSYTWSDSDWSGYSDITSLWVNDFTNGNYSMMSSDEWQETKAAIEDFKADYLTSDMTDFEKELKIIEWLVENCEYEKADDWSRATAYSCIVLGKAQCSGYADAFLQTAKLCGLEPRYVCNATHAWNLLKLDGDWYHVDVTWEDPLGSNNYGFGNLRNKYINLEDDEIRNVSSHHTWSPTTIKAKGIKYGPAVVQKYLTEGVIDTSGATSYKEQSEQMFAEIEAKEGTLSFFYSDTASAEEEMFNYLCQRIESRSKNYNILMRFGDKYSAATTGDYTKVSNIIKEIRENVAARINEKYATVLKNEINLYGIPQKASGGEYYYNRSVAFSYNEGTGQQIPYTLHFICNGEELDTSTGTVEQGIQTRISFPDGYEMVKGETQILSGNGSFSGTGHFTVYGQDAFEANVTVQGETMTYYIRYETVSGVLLEEVKDSAQVGTLITPEAKEFDGWEIKDESDLEPYTLSGYTMSRVIQYKKADQSDDTAAQSTNGDADADAQAADDDADTAAQAVNDDGNTDTQSSDEAAVEAQ